VPVRFSPEFALSLPLVSDAQISPDGETIAFVIAEQSRPSGPNRPAFAPSAIHAVPAAGGQTRRLTFGRADSMPRWSPDGGLLAFLSDREKDGQRQVFVLPFDGGEARQLTHFDSEIPVGRSFNPLLWFPDGSGLVLPLVDPLDPMTRSRNEAGNDRIAFEEEPRYWRLWAVDVTTGAAGPISPAGLQVWEFAISPDGRRVAAVASDEPYEWAWYNARLVAFDVRASSKADVQTIHASWRQVAKPTWSPDGYEVAFLTSNWSDRGIDAGQPMVVSAAGGAARPVGEGERASDLLLTFSPEGRLFAAANVRAGAGVSAIDVETGHRSWMWSAKQSMAAMSYAHTPGGADRFAAVIEDFDHAAEIHVGKVVDGQLSWLRLTEINGPWRDVARGEIRDVSWTAPDGMTIDGFLALPSPAADADNRDVAGPLPLVTLVHGGPTSVIRYDYQPGRWARFLADAGLAVFMPNYRGSAGWGLEFAESNIGDMGGADLGDILAGVDRLVADGVADADRLGICGWSYGGYMTAWAIGRTDRFKAAMAGAAVTEWHAFHGRTQIHTWDRLHYGGADPYDQGGVHDRFNPFANVRAIRTPTLILHGEEDRDVPVEQAYLLHRALKELGVETSLVVYPREPHGFTEYAHKQDLFTRIRNWMIRHLGPDAAAPEAAPLPEDEREVVAAPG
jgi:dipeptidyl aminopeptidase/acylaminoacyl peptidase